MTTPPHRPRSSRRASIQSDEFASSMPHILEPWRWSAPTTSPQDGCDFSADLPYTIINVQPYSGETSLTANHYRAHPTVDATSAPHSAQKIDDSINTSKLGSEPHKTSQKAERQSKIGITSKPPVHQSNVDGATADPHAILRPSSSAKQSDIRADTAGATAYSKCDKREKSAASRHAYTLAAAQQKSTQGSHETAAASPGPNSNTSAIHFTRTERSKYHRIVDFIHSRASDPDGTSLPTSQSDNVCPLPTLREWSLANLRILALLMRDDPTIAEGYLRYTEHIYAFPDSYDWPALLRYDMAYRCAQATEGFRWGTRMSLVFLQHRLNMERPGRRRPGKEDVCERYNLGMCAPVERCCPDQRRHQCLGCGGAHPSIVCPSVYPPPSCSKASKQPDSRASNPL
ncbi:hypothetical protein THASP1DRAFT_27161 [Thamnocephalis sphaerospora]|uniref:Uncharacterized protein n=1 Tax=Thamnocephalis sphaerospora TaxID=78915 RepID=A0A4P9XY84_9FUNG|nr:hypothetical protein THASP1DRAFT_27161 [Thamnocephalis sphaerospora]|eukprot:RKP11062.1 hypothetical protein THASP1DRAFT_27161 [Thamnocephalis sphaerospora]